MEEVLGVEPLEFSEDEESLNMDLQPDSEEAALYDDFLAPLTPKSSLKSIIQQEDIRTDFSMFMAANKRCSDELNRGANPPLAVLEGFARRLWKEKVDKVGMLAYGVFIIRFFSEVERDAILKGGFIFFNKRPVIMKPWDPDCNFKKEDIRRVPIWIHLDDLELKYWGQASLFKIVEQIGQPIMIDLVTETREKLNFPRVFIDVSVQQEFPDLIWFENEYGTNVSVAVSYEWKPTICAHCHGMGHNTIDCRKKETKKPEWIVKGTKKNMDYGKADKEKQGVKNKSNDEFQPVTNGVKVKPVDKPTSTAINNSFQMLAECTTDMTVGDTAHRVSVAEGEDTRGGGDNKCKSYGFNEDVGRQSMWQELQSIRTDGSWVVLGDFNDILEKEERIGVRVKYKPSVSFINCISTCQLEDVKFGGSFYTWNNKQEGDDRIFSKIDRILANQKWLESYPKASVLFLNEGMFDHTPVLLTIFPSIHVGKRPFKYFRMWQNHPLFRSKVEEIWKKTLSGTKMYQLVTKLKMLKPILKELNKEGFSDIHIADFKANEELKEAQDKLQNDPLNRQIQWQEKEAREKYVAAHKAYCSFMSQKTKLAWVKDGDINSALFHSSIRDRRRQNNVFSIINTAGIRVDEPKEVAGAFVEFYKLLLGSQMENRIPVNKRIVEQGPRVTQQQADFLVANYTDEEVKQAVFSIPGIKAPGPDGFSSFFYQDNWDLVGREDLIKHYGRQSNRPNCMIKLDLQKAYDTMEWDFLEEMLNAFKFPTQFISLVMNCIRTPRFSIMLNGNIHGFFEAKRGLRQGDPMSPLLFVLGMEYLTRIMGKVGEKAEFSFHDRCKSLKLNHLCFADDVLLFCKGPGSVAWETLCKPKKAGGLGFLKIYDWNTAALIKHVWAIASKKDNIWVKWIHNVYIKHNNWWEYKGHCQGSWCWRKIVEIKEKLKNQIDTTQFSLLQYTIADGYKMLQQQEQICHWSKEAWGRLNVPKHSFMLWIAMLDRLKTKERLQRFQLVNDDECVLCRTTTETSQHLFFSCNFSHQGLQQVKRWLGWNMVTSSLKNIIRWIERAKIGKFKKEVFSTAIPGLVYMIWKSRNEKIWNDKTVPVDTIVQQLQIAVKNRITSVKPKKIQQKDLQWFDAL
uniref:Reverse transcriptase domain-containing protein n=1 Tax=Cannabis sativa TaxID=3483 RepID=A0A803PQL5_CANSA